MPRPDADPIIVAGDVSIDWLSWPFPAESGAGGGLNWRKREGTRMVARRGGALLLTDLVRAATRRPVVGPRLDAIEVKSPNEHLHSLVDLERNPPKRGEPPSFRVSRLRGFAGPDGRHPAQPRLEVEGSEANAALLVLDDSGNGFRHSPDAWTTLFEQARPDWQIVKMARPLAEDCPLWDAVRNGPRRADGKPDPERLIVVLNADDLRDEGIALSRRLSWERTAEDFVRELGSNGKLDTLATCAHLIVRFDCDGVIYHRGRSAEPPMLYFDASHGEGEFVDAMGSRMMGMTAAFTAAFAAALAEDPDHGLDAGIRHGMSASRRLAAAAFREDGAHAPDYPLAIAMMGAPDPAFVALPIPSKRIADGKMWSILHDTVGDPADAARRVVTDGPAAALARTPVARFGDLETADRREIESFRAIGNLLREYLRAPQTKPISIGVFGPPGAGKSFGVKQVAAHAARAAQGCKLEPLEFNLSQFTSLADLVAAFHLVRDSALSGAVPLVVFDEFDSAYNGELGWLRYFLAPMQDGKFLENGHPHPLSAAIFVFAGGTRASFESFAEPMTLAKDDERRLCFADAKGPDFASRLRGHIDILGPDPVDAHDLTYPIRRSFPLRSFIERRERRLKFGERLNVDEGVLNALVTIPAYRHGVRSMEAVLAMSALTGETKFAPAALPPVDQLALHVDAADFMARVRGERLEDEALREKLGELLHDAYRKQRAAIAEDEAERVEVASDAAMKDWTDLDEAFCESSRLQADDIPRKLRLIRCFMAKDIEGREPVESFELNEIALLAEREHERYNAERLRLQWRLGERDPSKRKSPFLVPWRDLAPKWRSLDERVVAAIPAALAAAGCRIYRVG